MLLLAVPPAGEVGQGKDGGTRADFLMPAYSGVSTTQSRTAGSSTRGYPVMILKIYRRVQRMIASGKILVILESRFS